MQGDLDMNSEGLPVRSVIDVVKNSQSEAFVDFLRGGRGQFDGCE